jgi:hypothetical protein
MALGPQGEKQQGRASRRTREPRASDAHQLDSVPVSDAAESFATPQLVPRNVLALQRVVGNSAATMMIQRALSGHWLASTPQQGQVIPAQGLPLTSQQFSVTARIDTTTPATDPVRHGQYRQYVRGEYRQNGVPQQHRLDDGPMTMNNWTEDKIGGKRYGYRARSNGAPSAWFADAAFSQTDTANGPYLRTFDTPSATAQDDEMELHFRGVLIDTRTNAVLDTRTWSVIGPPAPAPAPAPPAGKKYKWFDPRGWLGAMGVKKFK